MRGHCVTRTNRQTGTKVTVYSEGRGDWYTVCEDHGECIAHATRRQAEWFAPSPLDWCEGCREAQPVDRSGDLFDVLNNDGDDDLHNLNEDDSTFNMADPRVRSLS